jgi:hypothetical protein
MVAVADANMIWGASPAASKIALDDVPPSRSARSAPESPCSSWNAC